MLPYTTLAFVMAGSLSIHHGISVDSMKKNTDTMTETIETTAYADISAQSITDTEQQTDIILSNFVGKKSFEYKINDNFYISAIYPVLQGIGTESRTTEINKQLADFSNEINYVETNYIEGSPMCNYDLSFSIIQDTSDEFILETRYLYSDAGPYPKYGGSYYTFDVESGKAKKLDDYFTDVESSRERIRLYLQEKIDEDYNGEISVANIVLDDDDCAVYDDILHISFDRNDLTNSDAPYYEIPMSWILEGRNG